jgi:hypothetical protein
MSYVRHISLADGPLKTALIIRYTDIAALHFPSPVSWQGALIYLQLRSGILFGLKIDGKIDQLIEQIEELAGRLQGFDHDESQFTKIENALNAGLPFCTVSLMRHAATCPDDFLFHAINRRYGSGRIRDFFERRNSELTTLQKRCLDQYFSKLLSEQNPELIAFKQALDGNILDVLAQIGATLPHVADLLIAYNWLASVAPETRKRRQQVLLLLPWLRPNLIGLRPVPAQLDKLCQDYPVRPRWTSVRQAIVAAIDTGKPLFSELGNIFKLPRETYAWSRYKTFPESRIFPHDQVDMLLRVISWLPTSSRPAKVDEWKALECQFMCYLHLIASALRVPDFLILRNGATRPVGEAFVSEAHERMLIRWFRRDSQLRLRIQLTEQLTKRNQLIKVLSVADDFLMAIADALSEQLHFFIKRRRECTRLQQQNITAWLELTTLNEIAQLSLHWERAMNTEKKIACAEPTFHDNDPSLPQDTNCFKWQDPGAELAWNLMQTNRLGKKFRKAWTQTTFDIRHSYCQLF